MSVHFIIDGYNFINHPRFSASRKKRASPQAALFDFIRLHRLAGSRKNRVTVVFDGYPAPRQELPDDGEMAAVFSGGQEADERIKRMVEASGNPKNLIVVSDDKQIRMVIRALGAHPMTIEEFTGRLDAEQEKGRRESAAPELGYSEAEKINKELRRLWLKE